MTKKEEEEEDCMGCGSTNILSIYHSISGEGWMGSARVNLPQKHGVNKSVQRSNHTSGEEICFRLSWVFFIPLHVWVKSSQVKVIFIEGKRLSLYNFFHPALTHTHTQKENQENLHIKKQSNYNVHTC